jgi:hypothetical protein
MVTDDRAELAFLVHQTTSGAARNAECSEKTPLPLTSARLKQNALFK